MEALDAIRANQSLRQLVVLPTGTGKTVLFAELAKDFAQHGRVLILVHRDELVRQTVAKLTDTGLTDIGIMEGVKSNPRANITVASVQTMARDARMIAWLRNGKAILAITDEAHHAPAPTYQKVINYALAPRGLHVGFTATPDRETQKQYQRRTRKGIMSGTTLTAGMGKVFDSLSYYRSFTDMVGEGWLCDVVPAQAQTTAHLASVPMTGGDWQEGALGQALVEARADQDIVSAWETSAKGRATIAFLPTVETSQLVRDAFLERGYRAEHVDGATPHEVRQAIYGRLRDGTTQVVTNCMVLTEGFDEPSVSCIIVGRPTQSRALFAQMIGRGSRLHPDKSECVVLSLVNHDLDLPPLTLQTFLDDKGWENGESLSSRKRKLAETGPDITEDDHALKVEAIAFRQAFIQQARASLIWRKVGPSWHLTAGKEGSIKLIPQGEKWEVSLGEKLLADTPLPLDGAVAIAETYVRGTGGAKLSDANADWRKAQPTPAQITLATKLGISHQGLTKGEVSDLISEKMSEPATPKQIAYARKLGHPNPEAATKRELMAYIGSHKR